MDGYVSVFWNKNQYSPMPVAGECFSTTAPHSKYDHAPYVSGGAEGSAKDEWMSRFELYLEARCSNPEADIPFPE